MSENSTIAAMPALVAALALAATPASAADFAVSSARGAIAQERAWHPGDDTYANHRWRGWRGRDDDDIDAGDVLTGILIIGGIAAIAGAMSNDGNDRDRDSRDGEYRDRDYRNGDYRDQDRDRENGVRGESDIERAVSSCVAEVGRNQRVDRVNTVNRTADGWAISGALYNGEPFSCRVDSYGRVESIDPEPRAAPYRGSDSSQLRQDRQYTQAPSRQQDRQYSDARYAAAWEQIDRQAGAGQRVQVQPAYPGGPMPSSNLRPIDGDLAAATPVPAPGS